MNPQTTIKRQIAAHNWIFLVTPGSEPFAAMVREDWYGDSGFEVVETPGAPVPYVIILDDRMTPENLAETFSRYANRPVAPVAHKVVFLGPSGAAHETVTQFNRWLVRDN